MERRADQGQVRCCRGLHLYSLLLMPLLVLVELLAFIGLEQLPVSGPHLLLLELQLLLLVVPPVHHELALGTRRPANAPAEFWRELS